VLVVGGYYTDLPANPPMHMIGSSEIYDPKTGAWSTTGSLATARYGAGAATLTDGRVLVVGGWPDVDNDWPAPNYGQHQKLNTAEIYDPKTGRWSAAGALPHGMAEPTVIPLPDGDALAVTGGVARFDARTSSWTETTPITAALDRRVAIALADGRVLVAGGWTGDDYLADAELFDPDTGTWAAAAPLPNPRGRGAAIRLQDGSILVVGGEAAPGEGDPSCPLPAVGVVRFVP
jgi:N-acetylneuraminic acid mutarotase